ncbi:MAG: FRG domain-containing protein [Halothece sp.]
MTSKILVEETVLEKPSIESFLETIQKKGAKQYTLYRGQSRKQQGSQTLKAKPSIARNTNNSPKQFFDFLKKTGNFKEFAIPVGVESGEVPEWVSNINDINWLELEKIIMERFEELSMKVGDTENLNRLEQLVKAQHLGIPTRLLDWTTNPLKALFFAVYNSNYYSTPSGEGIDGVVYLLNYNWRSVKNRKIINSKLESNDSSIENIQPFFPKPTNHPRVYAQESCFTIFPYPENFEEMKALEEIKEGEYDTINRIAKIIIPANYKYTLHTYLELFTGINYTTLFPDLDGVAKEINGFFERVFRVPK